MGNINALRDWGHAKDYVRMQWLMLQQDKPEDYVIATGSQFSVREFIQWSGEELGIKIKFEGQGIKEIGIVEKISGSNAPSLNVGDVIVKIDPAYFRPTEVDNLIGDPSKAARDLKWIPEISAKDMCSEMIQHDLKQAKKKALLTSHGYKDTNFND